MIRGNEENIYVGEKAEKMSHFVDRYNEGKDFSKQITVMALGHMYIN